MKIDIPLGYGLVPVIHSSGTCLHCYFDGSGCKLIHCTPDTRDDGEYVFYALKRVKWVEDEK